MARKIEPKPGDKYNMLTYVGDEGREPSAVMCGKQLYTRLGRWKCDCGKEIVCRNRYVVTIQVLDSDPGDMVQYAPESPSRAGKET